MGKQLRACCECKKCYGCNLISSKVETRECDPAHCSVFPCLDRIVYMGSDTNKPMFENISHGLCEDCFEVAMYRLKNKRHMFEVKESMDAREYFKHLVNRAFLSG